MAWLICIVKDSSAGQIHLYFHIIITSAAGPAGAVSSVSVCHSGDRGFAPRNGHGHLLKSRFHKGSDW